jgi:lysophospholipase L1-like esterase
MLFRRTVATLLVVACVTCTATTPIAPRQFRKGDRVVVVGDSITHGRRYHAFVYLFYATRLPDSPFSMYNCGISGDSADGAVSRLQWDILPNKPTVATIMLGMNDVSHGLYAPDKAGEAVEKQRRDRIESHITNMKHLADALREAGADLMFITPSIYDQTATLATESLIGVNDALGTCGRRMTKLAPAYNAGVIDFHGPMGDINTRIQKQDPTRTIVGKDRVHPGDPGQFVMAYLMLKAQGLPGTVAEMTIDARNAKILASANCEITELQAQPDGITMTCLEHA